MKKVKEFAIDLGKFIFAFIVCNLVWILLGLIASLPSGCKKANTEAECVDWKVTYYEENKASNTTVTTSYLPYDRKVAICGVGKDTVFLNKKCVLSENVITRHVKLFVQKY